ncbi:MAG TPA: CBS domain-containing protein [Thermoleophilaceae bacterium]|nr:CBS domain-containing protein [Thermoleophilaceae bacterium]
MSPRAACRLEQLGFERIYDYVPGKIDWLARGLPFEGEAASVPRVGAVARDDVVTCRLEDRVRDVGPLVEGSPYGFGLVTTAAGTVLGRLRSSALESAAAEASAGSIMEPGPSTVRPDLRAVELAQRLEKRGLTTAIVTTPEGRLLGVVRRDELERSASK